MPRLKLREQDREENRIQLSWRWEAAFIDGAISILSRQELNVREVSSMERRKDIAHLTTARGSFHLRKKNLFPSSQKTLVSKVR